MAKKHVRIDDDNYRALEQESERTELSIARIVNKVLREWKEKQEQEKE
jgi:hypothetical protein